MDVWVMFGESLGDKSLHLLKLPERFEPLLANT